MVVPLVQNVNQAGDSVSLDPEYIEHFTEFLESVDLPGPDYFEFAQVVRAMESENSGMSKEQIYRMAYIGFKAQGHPAKMFIDTAMQYLSYFEEHKGKFEQYLSSETDTAIGTKRSENIALTKKNGENLQKIADLKAQIKAIETENSQNSQKIKINEEAISNEEERIRKKRTRFETTYEWFKELINTDIANMNNFLSQNQKP
ncbi:hypothetical protein IPJ63_02585 [Candidatus Nomurabacteria bacterium]|nr:MAG: hypothetical protein IPJ63_02585 [Candidatus Nomurabacteria bacterium]